MEWIVMNGARKGTSGILGSKGAKKMDVKKWKSSCVEERTSRALAQKQTSPDMQRANACK